MLRSFFHTRCILTCLFDNLQIVTVMGGEEAAGRGGRVEAAGPRQDRVVEAAPAVLVAEALLVAEGSSGVAVVAPEGSRGLAVVFKVAAVVLLS